MNKAFLCLVIAFLCFVFAFVDVDLWKFAVTVGILAIVAGCIIRFTATRKPKPFFQVQSFSTQEKRSAASTASRK